MNYSFLMSLKYSIESIHEGLNNMQENCTYITQNNLISENSETEFLLDYCVLACRFQPHFLNGHKKLLNLINRQIYSECKHKWITDWIDEGPDKTKRIQYCEYCECTKK